MELPSDQQIFELIKKSGNILIVLPENLTADALASGLALRLFLQKLEKNVQLAASGQIAENLKFLPGSELLQSKLASGQSLVITLDTSVKRLEEISYQTGSHRAQIYLKSQDEPFTEQDLTFAQEKSKPDLIVALGTKSLAALGRLYETSTDVFFETPKINIDNQPDNDYFGTLNLIELTATSVAEILSELLQQYEQQLIDQDIATCLLAGIISSTKSFQHVQTTPRAFLKASELVSLGGRQQEIVKNIYQTKSLPLLKLWGRALARMKILGVQKTVYSILNFTDFEKAEAGEEQLLPTLKEFIDNISGYSVIALIAEPVKNSSRILAAIGRQLPAEKFLAEFAGARLLDVSLDHYQVIELIGEDSLDSLESQFIQAAQNLT